jgi:hypothetical protein
MLPKQQEAVDPGAPPEPPNDSILREAVAEIEERAKKAEQEASVRAEEANLYLTYYLYERTYRVIFGTQIRLLKHLNSVPFASAAELKAFHDAHLQMAGALSANYHYDFGHYLGFLTSSWLVTMVSPESYSITNFGRGFLHYMVESGLSEWRPN